MSGTAEARPAAGDVSSSEGVAADELRQFIERLERLEEEKAGLAGDIKDVFAESSGSAGRTMRSARRRRRSSSSTCRRWGWCDDEHRAAAR